MNWHDLSAFERLIFIIGYTALVVIVYLAIIFAVAFVIIFIEDTIERFVTRRRLKQKQEASKTIKAIPRKVVRYNWKGKIY